MNHELKCWPGFFKDIRERRKNFTVRKDDRGIKVGDDITFKEWDPETEKFTGVSTFRRVMYRQEPGTPGVELGYVVLGLQ